jgi:hypothetical protein
MGTFFARLFLLFAGVTELLRYARPYSRVLAKFRLTRINRYWYSRCPVIRVVSMGRRNTQLEPTLH